MKDESHHLKHVQKRVLRSVRRKSLETKNIPSFSTNEKSPILPWKGEEVVYYKETVPSDQQVPRAPMRMRNSFH